MCSDDTEHNVMVAQALIESGFEPDLFQRAFAGRLRWWITRVPAGVGFGTLRACLKLWMGWSPDRSGVSSAGNGPAMRSATIGIAAQDAGQAQKLIALSCRVTHSDPRADQGAQAIAVIGRLIAEADGRPITAAEVRRVVMPAIEDAQFNELMRLAIDLASKDASLRVFRDTAGFANGVSGFVVHTVPAAVYCWLVNQGSYRQTIEAAVTLGGDTDTVAAIAGGLSGAQLGCDAIPDDWSSQLIEWPCTKAWMGRLAEDLAACADGRAAGNPPELPIAGLVIRNVVFIPIVLAHGLRRLLPPY